MDQTGPNPQAKYYTGKVVTQNEPFWEKGKYWGYQVRVAHSVKEVFENGPWKYDLKIGDSQKRESKAVDDVNWAQYGDFKHALVFFGGLNGVEGTIADMETDSNLKPAEIFDEYVNTLTEIGTRSIRTEEMLLVSLGQLVPKMRQNGHARDLASSFVNKERRALLL